MDEKKQEKKTNPINPRVIMLSSGHQVIAGLYYTEGSDFLRLTDPYRIRVHESPVDDKSYFVDERMSLTPWIFQTIDKVYSVHKDHIMSIAVPNKNLTEYYNNVRLGLYPTIKKELKPLASKEQHEKSFEQVMEEMSDEDYWETLQYLRGKIKAN